MGWIHWLAYQNVPGVEVVAVCERDKKRLAGDWTDIKGNFGPPGEKVDLSGIATYENLEDLFADQQVDLVDICLPPSFHVDVISHVLELDDALNGDRLEKLLEMATRAKD